MDHQLFAKWFAERIELDRRARTSLPSLHQDHVTWSSSRQLDPLPLTSFARSLADRGLLVHGRDAEGARLVSGVKLRTKDQHGDPQGAERPDNPSPSSPTRLLDAYREWSGGFKYCAQDAELNLGCSAENSLVSKRISARVDGSGRQALHCFRIYIREALKALGLLGLQQHHQPLNQLDSGQTISLGLEDGPILGVAEVVHRQDILRAVQVRRQAGRILLEGEGEQEGKLVTLSLSPHQASILTHQLAMRLGLAVEPKPRPRAEASSLHIVRACGPGPGERLPDAVCQSLVHFSSEATTHA